MLQRLINGTRIVLPPFDDFFNNMAYPPLLRPPRLLPFGLPIFITFLIVLILNVGNSGLSVHKAVNMQKRQIFDFDVQRLFAVYFCQLDANFISNWIDATVNKHITLYQKV